MNLRELAESRIVIDPDVLAGKPRIRGTRVTVADILLSLAEGLSEQEILRTHRGLRAEDLKAAMAYSYCVSDGIKLKIGSGTGTETKHIDVARRDPDLEAQNFTKALESQAAIQEEITKTKIAQIKEEKSKKKANATKPTAPEKREAEFDITISENETLRIFHATELYEQALDLNYDVYVFEQRSDGLSWLTYSNKEGIEIDQGIKRLIKVNYRDGSTLKQGVFDGYLTNDRHHKIFIQRLADGKSGGRGL